MKHTFSMQKKAIVATLIFICLVTGTAFSQTSRFSLFINSSTTNFYYGQSNSELQPFKKNYRGLQAGVSYQAGISQLFSVVPELYFATKGGVLKENNPATTGKSTLRLSTIEMPVLGRFHSNRLYLNAGPYIAYTLGGRIKTDASQGLPEKSTPIAFGNAAGDFARWDWGTQAGLGYHFNMKKTTLTLDLRYSYGLHAISTDKERYNRVFSISLILSGPGKKRTDKDKNRSENISEQ